MGGTINYFYILLYVGNVEIGGAVYLGDYASAIDISSRTLFFDNKASFGAVFAGKGFVNIRDITRIENNVAGDQMAFDSILSDPRSRGVGSLYWFEGTVAPIHNNQADFQITPCRYFHNLNAKIECIYYWHFFCPYYAVF